MQTTQTISRKNNFDVLRFGLAYIVVFVHMFDLTGYANLAVLKNFLSSEMAVQSFFVISGFLIFMSYERSSSLKSYFKKRFKRIYPAYALIICISIFAGAFITDFTLKNYLSIDLIKYIFANLTFLNFIEPSLPGVFLNNPVMSSVNGALWTLKVEVMFYISVPIIVWLIKKYENHRIKILSAIYILSYIFKMFFLHMADSSGRAVFFMISKQLPGQLCYFISGALIFYYFSTFLKNKNKLFILGIMMYLLSNYSYLGLLRPISLAIIVMFIAFSFSMFNNFGKYGDFSYGAYIFHFPIIQYLISIGFYKERTLIDIGFTLVLVTLCAVLSWHLIEKRFLKR